MAPKAKAALAALAALPPAPSAQVDANNNAGREEQEAQHKYFVRQLKKCSADHKALYANLPTARKHAFREKWASEHNLDWVAEMKSMSGTG